MTNKALCLITACGAALGLAGTANAQLVPGQPYLVNGSGATLLENFADAPALTNDFIDVDGDGLVGLDADQLAPPDIFAPFQPFTSQSLIVSYRVDGSGNGFAELVQFGLPGVFAVGDPIVDNMPVGSDPLTLDLDTSRSFQNRVAIITNADTVGPNGIATNPGGYRVLSETTGPNQFRAASSGGGIHMDFANLDVPVFWFATQSGTPTYNAVPNQAGYGDNPVVSLNKDGSVNGQSNRLKSLVGPNGTANTNSANPNANTIFDTNIALVPVAAIANPGTDLVQIDMSDLQYYFTTGRGKNGQNLMIATRDSGSGTRNAFANGIGVDPSWCIGENIGPRDSDSATDRIGPNYQSSHRGSSSRLEGNVRNHRLGLGQTGAERGDGSWLESPNAGSFPNNRILNSLPVRADIKGGTVFAGPTLANTIAGGPDGWNITGPAAIATVGDPRSNDASVGGWGFLPDGPDGIPGNADDETGPYPFPSAPMANAGAAAFINNLTRSIDAFQALPGADQTLFTPGELAAVLYVLPNAADNIPNPNPNPMTGFIDQVPNPTQNLNLRSYLLDPGTPNALKNPRLADASATATGQVPSRTATLPNPYSDAAETGSSSDGGRYLTQGGALVTGGSNLAARNKVAFDFDGNGLREIADVAEAYLALLDREAGAGFQWVAPAGNGLLASEHTIGIAGSDAIVEILGDATGDGNFDREDMRYFADGLAIDSSSGNLNRFMGYQALDNQEANFFGIAAYTTGATYKAGDAAADVAGQAQTPGYVPNGADGVINNADVDYVAANFGDWSTLTEAVNIDLSADMNGDLVVNLDDACWIIETVLGTEFGDLDLDGDRDASDAALVNVGGVATYSNGDVNLDGVIDAIDQAIAGGSQSFGCNVAVCTGDIADDNGTPGADGQVSFGDFLASLGLLGPCGPATSNPDCTGDNADDNGTPGGDGQVSFGDFLFLLGVLGPCP